MLVIRTGTIKLHCWRADKLAKELRKAVRDNFTLQLWEAIERGPHVTKAGVQGSLGFADVPYTIVADGIRESRARPGPRSQVHSEDPFGGCRLRCPRGFKREDYHIHMHR